MAIGTVLSISRFRAASAPVPCASVTPWLESACRDGSVVASDLRRRWITQIPLEHIHPRLDRSKLRFLFSNLLLCRLFAVVHGRTSLFQMRADLSCARLFFFLFLLFRCQMQREAANHFSLCVDERKRRRSLSIVILRNMEEHSCAERWVITGIGWASLVGIGKTVIVSQPGFLRGKQETGVGVHGRVLG